MSATQGAQGMACRERPGVLERFAMTAGTWLVAHLIRLTGRSWRFDEVDRHLVERDRLGGGGVIYAFWHGRMIIPAFTHRRRDIHVLISEHRDGELITRIIDRLGFHSVRGSTTRGGARALFGMATAGQRGFDLAVTPDGPRGPRFRFQIGALSIAQRTGLAVVPAGVAAYPCIVLRTWDRFVIPVPFCRCVIVYGEPMIVPPECTREALDRLRAEAESILRTLTARAEELARLQGRVAAAEGSACVPKGRSRPGRDEPQCLASRSAR